MIFCLYSQSRYISDIAPSMSNDQTLLEGFFQASGRKRYNPGCGPIPKRTKDISGDLSPKKSILSMGFVSLRKEQTKQQPPQQITRKAKAAPARKPRASKKLMQASAPTPATKSSRRNVKPASNDTFLQLDKALSRSKSPLKSSTPLNAGMKALSAAKQDTPTVLEPVMTTPISPQRLSTVLKIPTAGASTREQIKRLTNKLQEAKKNQTYTVPPLPNITDKTLAQRLAEPTSVELKDSKEVLKPIEFPTEASCLSPSRKDILQRRLALLKTPEKSPKMKEFREIQFTSPTKKQYNTTPLKSPQYQKSHHLTVDTQLPLSYTQSILLDHFRCIDVVISMLDRRKENCTFEKLQRSVTTMSGKQMNLKTLSQIIYLYPNAFSLSYQPIRTSIQSPRRGQLELVIIANNDVHSESPIRKNIANSQPLSNQELLTRKKQFHSYIIDYVKGYHVEYLEQLNPPIIIPTDKIVKRWHPNFNLDTVPIIPDGNMPLKPQRNTPQTAKQILASSQELLPTRFTRVMLKFTEDNTSLDPISDTTTTNNCNNTNELKGVSKNLIERIRIREQEKAKLNMIRDDISLHKLDMLERLPEMCSIVRNMYLAQQRGTLPWADVLHKLKDSHHSKMEQKFMEEHLTLLLEVLPDWISLVNLKGAKFLKVKRNTPLNSLLSHLQCEKTRLDLE